MISSTQCRYDQVREFQNRLKTLTEEYQIKIKKYRRRITAIDVIMYSVSSVLTGAGIILASVTMIAPVVVPICISAVATIGGISTGIAKKISSCSQSKLQNYLLQFHIASTAYSQLSLMISSSLDNTIISDSEFSAMVSIFDSAISKLEQQHEYNNNDNTDGIGKHKPKNQNDLNSLNVTKL